MLPDFNVDGFFLPSDLSLTEVMKNISPQVAQRRVDLDAQRRAAETNGSDLVTVIPDLEFAEINFTLLPVIDEWMEGHCYDYSKVNPLSLRLDDPKRPAPLIVLEDYQRDILRHIFPPGGYKGGISKYTTVWWSQPKKSGKTQIAANVGSYCAQHVDPPNTILAIANKKDQAEDRVYRSMKPTIKGLGGSVPTAPNSKPLMLLPNGTQIRALPNSPSTEAGDSYILTLWTEIWAFKTQTDERLYAELMPVETQRVSMRWIESYVGYWDESIRLKEIFLKAFTDSTERVLSKGARYVPELAHIVTDGRPACIEIPSEGLFIFLDHERRMPWQTKEKYDREYRALPRVEAIRLLDNRWQSSSSELLEEAWITESITVADQWPKQFAGRKFTLAVDAAQRHDSIALVGSFKEGENYWTPFCEIYDPHGQDANLHDLVENRVKALFDEGLLESYFDEKEQRWLTPVYFDIFQLHQIRLNCIAYGIDVIEFNQGETRTRSDTMLYHLYKDGLVHNPAGREDLYEHLRAGKAKYSEGEKIRILKGTTMDAKRIDALVAQSMSFYGAFLAEQTRLTQEDTSSLLIMDSTTNSWFGTDNE